MRKIALICLFLSISAIPVSSMAEPASKESIKKMMVKTGAGKMGVQVMGQMIPALKQMIPDAPEEFWQGIMAEVNADKLIELVIPVYQKHLTEEDIKGINAFYDSPAGKKLIKVQPEIVQESMLIGQKWGEQIAQDVLLKYKEQNKKQP
ncbi:FIG01059457: hypothetical protein [hydrothermal vent metagenome]|uniref:DUF2059 domain-containing protein n=1 Tax=hydrothermal vent metagenome TaxID=652676 RepID=A0A3B0YB00_9ZZZZ